MSHIKECPTTSTALENRQKYSFSDEILPFEMGYLPPRFQRKAERELNETPENIQKGIKLLREMAKKDKNFHGQTFSDDLILQFLRCKKFDFARAFACLKRFAILRKKNVEMFTNIKFQSISMITRKSIMIFLPWRCHEGCAIIHFKLLNWNPEEFPLEDYKRAIMASLMQASLDPMNQVNGYKLIMDVNGNPLKQVRYCTPSNIYLLYHGTQECAPGRLKEIHVVNRSLVFTVGYAIVKSFMSYEIKQRFVFHSSPKTLLNYFPPSVLPVEYGGDLQPCDTTDWLRKVTAPEMLAIQFGKPPSVPTHS